MSSGERHELDQFDAAPVRPIYWQKSPNAEIDLGTFQGTLAGSKSPVSGNAIVRFVPKKQLTLMLDAPADESSGERFLRTTGFRGMVYPTIELNEYRTSFTVFPLKEFNDSTLYCPKMVPMQIFESSDSISECVFHLFNWPDFMGSEDFILRTVTPLMDHSKRSGRFHLTFGGWTVTVTAAEGTDAAVKALRESGGFSITHVGKIQRADSGVFSTSELENVLHMLMHLFAFVLGKWSSPCMPVGFDKAGQRVYEEWGMRRCDEGSWFGTGSLFDMHHPQMFGDVLPGFWKLWSSETWNQPLREAIYWYLNGNRGGSGLGVDSAMLFTQAALELLSWTYCVVDRKMVSEKAFSPSSLSAADKLRLLTTSLGIPQEIPNSLASLHAKQGKKWSDSMDAITELRNRLVHPGTDRNFPKGAYYDGWRLSMWYLDVILLKLCEFSGDYNDRLSEGCVGQVSPVPRSRNA